jgi:hypothetical protein
MKQREITEPVAGRQMSLKFDADLLFGIAAPERRKAVIALARILTQAAGIREEAADEHR